MSASRIFYVCLALRFCGVPPPVCCHIIIMYVPQRCYKCDNAHVWPTQASFDSHAGHHTREMRSGGVKRRAADESESAAGGSGGACGAAGAGQGVGGHGGDDDDVLGAGGGGGGGESDNDGACGACGGHAVPSGRRHARALRRHEAVHTNAALDCAAAAGAEEGEGGRATNTTTPLMAHSARGMAVRRRPSGRHAVGECTPVRERVPRQRVPEGACFRETTSCFVPWRVEACMVDRGDAGVRTR